jgi:hypothetical protein
MPSSPRGPRTQPNLSAGRGPHKSKKHKKQIVRVLMCASCVCVCFGPMNAISKVCSAITDSGKCSTRVTKHGVAPSQGSQHADVSTISVVSSL